MHPALLKLMRLRGWAFCRRIVRSMKTVRGAVMTLFMLVMFGLMVGPSLYLRLTMSGDNPPLDQDLSDHVQSLEDAAPIGLMLMSIFSAFTAMGEKAISFSPAEVNFLFPAPFTRRELLLYRITASSFGGLLFAAIMSVSFQASVRSWPAAFIGLFLTLQLVNLLSIISALVAQVISQQAYTLGRRIVWVAVGLLLAIGLTDVLSSANLRDPWEAASKFRNTWAGVCLTAPFAVYTDMILADGLNALFLGRLLLAGGINLLLVVLAIRLDANYLEEAGHISERLYERMRQMQRGGGFSVASKPGKSYRRFLPSLPRWRGVGSILQVQLTLGFRTSGRLVAVGAIVAVLIVASSTLFSEDNDITEQLVTSSLVIGITAYLTLLGAMTLPLGLRGDVDHMDWLKSMPVTPLVVALGEVLGPALFMSFIHGSCRSSTG